jgi:V/A-type H+-transporting ATPase subunit I
MMDALRPEQMSKVSVTGAKAVMDDVVDVVHDMNLLHVTDYDGSWEGFSPGDPVEGADEVSQKLVTVRSLESILDVDEEDAGTNRLVTDEAVETELEEIRERVNELDDRRESLQDQLQNVESSIDAMAPFATLGIDLDLLQGYDTLQVQVGEGAAADVRSALAAADEVDAFELFTGDGVVAAFARPAEGAGEDALGEALVGVEFGQLEVPDLEEGPVDVDVDDPTPQTYLEALEARRDQLHSKLDTVENELEDEKLTAAGFLLAVEETLSIEAQKREAPLSFATTDNAFVAEGWIPTDRYEAFRENVNAAVDGRVEIEELERADYDDEGHPEASEHTEEGAAATDGGTTVSDSPPVIQDNPEPAKPFEVLVQTVARPKYDEFDPTTVLWLTFPVFFGFMIGDLGYGLLYLAIGYAMWSRFDNDAIRALGGVGMWAGLFTAIFGILYGELFGLHQLATIVWGGEAPIHKGLQPADSYWAVGWIIVTVLVGVLHVTLGYTFSFAQDLRHGLKDAVLESGSWALMMWGLWGWIFSEHLADAKPGLVVGTGGVFYEKPFALGFVGLPAEVGLVGAGMFVLGLVLVGIAEPVEFIEGLFLQVLVRALSYTRIAAVLLAKAGMAFVVNLLVFGAYAESTPTGDAFHFLYFSENTIATVESAAKYELIFPGVLGGAEGGVAVVVGALAGLLIFVLGHLVVLGLGITSAGLQGVRLEYVEFFSEFYEGGGTEYEPFGYEREYTVED